MRGADDAEQSRCFGAGRAIVEVGEFVRHGDEQAADVGYGGQAAHDVRQGAVGRLLGHSGRIVVDAPLEAAGQTFQR